MIAKLTRRQSRALRGQVGDPGIWGQAWPLMGRAEGLWPVRNGVSWVLGQDISQIWGDSSLLASFLFQGLAGLRGAVEGR